MEFVLASTNEEIGVPVDCAAYVEGRSSVGRMGVQVQNAGFIDAGFRGQITLELQNQSKFPIRLSSGMRICQLVYVQMTSPSSFPYNGKYQFQKGATESRLYQDLMREVTV
jgi:dCTP deaminase